MGIVVEGIRKAYVGKVVLDGVSFEVKDGAFVTFLAPTGEGKTSLLRIMAGVEKPDRGKIYYDGKDVTNLPVQERDIAMVYQWFVNYPSMSVYENIASPLRVSKQKISQAEIDRRVRETATLLKIDMVLDHKPSEISGGQQQRLAIARAMAKGADYIFLDEPLTNLDYKLREELRVELKNIFGQKKRGAVVFATPEPVDALSLSSYVGFLHKGKLLQYGPVEEVYRNPEYKEVGSYFSHPAMNLLECAVVKEDGRRWLKATEELKVEVSEYKDRLTADGYLIGIRAHFLNTRKESEGMIPVKARVELAEVVGSDTELHLSHRGLSLVALLQGVESYELGQEITVYLDMHRIFIYDKATGKLVAKTHRD